MSVLNSALYTREYFLQDNICRFCWTKDAGNELYTQLINCNLESPLFLQKVENCLDIDLSQDDTEYHPKKVCQTCFYKIEEFHDFKTFCQDSNEKLSKILNADLCKPFITIEISPEAIKSEKLEHSAYFDLESVESLDGFIDSLQRSESCLDTIIESHKSAKSTKKYLENVKNVTIKEEKTKTLKNHQNPLRSIGIKKSFEDTEKSSSNTLLQAESIINNIKPSYKTTNTCKKSTYRHKKSSKHCNICYEDFPDEDTFIKHNSEAHGIEKDGKFKCFGCGKLHVTRTSRLCHETHYCKELEHGYKCSICNKYLPKRGVYEKHMRDHKLNKLIDPQEENLFKCNKCPEKFSNRLDWKAHKEGHVPKNNYICETCGKVFSRLDYLNKHNVVHTGIRRYVCIHCGFQCSQKNNLTIHIRKHTDERPYPCDLCPQRCVSKSNLLAHRRRHLGLKAFQCTFCNKKFGYKLSLKEHIAVTHEHSQSHPCPHCGLVYARRRGLRRHLQNKHAAEPKDVKENTAQSTSNENGKNGEEKNSNENPEDIPEVDINVENNSVQEGNEDFDLKIGENDKFVCFEKNLDFGKGSEKIVIVLQE